MSRGAWAVLRPRLAAASLALILAGCGGGLFVGFGNFGFDSSAPPSVSLATASSAQRGETVRLVAAASDDFGIDQVAFFRDESTGAVLLGTDISTPYELDTQIPLNAATPVNYFAQARDFDGNVTQSATVSVTVVP